MYDLIADRYEATLIRERYTALEEVTSSLRRYRDEVIRSRSTSADIPAISTAHDPSLDTFVDYMRESYDRLETSILEACYGTEQEPTDGEPYWRLRAYYTVTWKSSEPDGSTFIEEDSNLEGEWYFRSELDAMEWAKYLQAKDSEIDIDSPRFFGEG